MTKYILASATSLMLLVAPTIVMAQANNGSEMGSSDKMKGPPNANGMQMDKSSGAITSGRSESSGSSNGAASATSTGEDKH